MCQVERGYAETLVFLEILNAISHSGLFNPPPLNNHQSLRWTIVPLLLSLLARP